MSTRHNHSVARLTPLICLCATLAVAPGCSVEAPNPEGRACDTDDDCGPGTRCDTAQNKCVKTGNGTPPDGAPDIQGQPDQRQPDQRQPDSYKVPPGGCPSGYTKCGLVCAMLSSDKRHCGKCGNPCPPSSTDSCVNGKCVCGSASSATACGSGQDCKAGACKCVKGGRCTGCCDGNSCLQVGSAQSLSKCGKGGDACRVCKTSQCALTSCSAGDCKQSYKTASFCNDGVPCTHTDLCSSSGVCAGTKYSCGDNATCTTDTCTGNKPPYHCNYKVSSGHCAIKSGSTTICYKHGTKHPKDSCLQCDTTNSSTVWTKISGCSTTATVTTLMSKLTLKNPRGVAVDKAGLVYIADTNNHTILRINTATSVTTWMGGKSGTAGFSDGTGSAALFNSPSGIAVDSAGNIFVADSGNHAIRRISAGSGATSTLAGTGKSGSTNGSTKVAQFYNPCGVAVDASGNIYVGDTYTHRIRLLTKTTVSTYAGSTVGFADGTLTTAKFKYPYHVALGPNGRLFVADYGNNRIRMISGTKVSTLAGNGSQGHKDGSASSAMFYMPRGVAVGSSGKVYVGDYSNHRVRVISYGTVSTLAGVGTYGTVDGSALTAKFHTPHGVAVHSSGKIYVVDYGSSRLRLISISGTP